jgi:hypothetical protein
MRHVRDVVEIGIDEVFVDLGRMTTRTAGTVIAGSRAG